MVNNMCLLTLIPPTITLDYDRAKRAAISNPDGFGFAIHAGTAIIKDHDMDFDKLWVRWSELTKIYNNNASLFHWRISTHGTTSVDNCHPFDVGDSNNVVLGHNGMLPITMPINDTRSDTKLFAQFVLPSLGGAVALDNPSVFKNIEEWAIGSKLVVLSADPKTQYDWYILNETAGHWAHDMWWSNSSYKPFTYSNYSGYSGYTGKPYTSPYLGWDDEAYDDTLNDKDDQLDLGWTIHDSEQYIMEELYQDDIIETILSFTDYSDADFAKVSCNNCKAVYYVDALDASATHCGDCTACLACGKPGCNCWDNYEYGQSFLNWDTIRGEVSVETQIKS